MSRPYQSVMCRGLIPIWQINQHDEGGQLHLFQGTQGYRQDIVEPFINRGSGRKPWTGWTIRIPHFRYQQYICATHTVQVSKISIQATGSCWICRKFDWWSSQALPQQSRLSGQDRHHRKTSAKIHYKYQVDIMGGCPEGLPWVGV